MTLALDTSIIISIERREQIVLDRLKELEELHEADPVIPLMVYVELAFGVSTTTDHHWSTDQWHARFARVGCRGLRICHQ